jgi:hypothetical protein
MSMTNTMETALLALIYNNTGLANMGDATGLLPAGTVGSLYVSLHTADPLKTGNQTTNEATYTSYARVAVVRSSAGWTIAGNTASNAAAVNFATCTGGTSTITYFGIGFNLSGTGNLQFSGALSSSLAVSTNITPSFAIGALTITAD